MKIKTALTLGILASSYLNPIISIAETKELNTKSETSVNSSVKNQVENNGSSINTDNKEVSSTSNADDLSGKVADTEHMNQDENNTTTVQSPRIPGGHRYDFHTVQPSVTFTGTTTWGVFGGSKKLDNFNDEASKQTLKITSGDNSVVSFYTQFEINPKKVPNGQDWTSGYYIVKLTDTLTLADYPDLTSEAWEPELSYSTDNLNFTYSKPTDIEDIKAIKVEYVEWEGYIRFHVPFDFKVNWNVANPNGTSKLFEVYGHDIKDTELYNEQAKRLEFYSDTRAMVSANYKFKTETGDELADSEYLFGGIGDPYVTSPKDIPGYILKEMPNNVTGIFKKEDQVVNYIYLELGQPVTVNYVDEAGNNIPGVYSETLTGGIGERYTTVQKDIPGYTFKSVSGGTIGYFTNKAKTVTYTYKVAPINGGDVTVKYEDEQGKEIHKPQTIKGKPLGESYDASTAQYNIDIKGYKHKEVQGNVTGTFTDQPQTVTYVYSEGLLQFADVPQTMSFEDSKISSKMIEVKRKEADWKIKVEDTRLDKKNWRVSAKLTDSFKNTTGEETIVPILLYRQANQSDQWLDNNSEVNVFSGVSETDKEYYDVSWAEQSGPLLSIAPGAVKVGQYKGEVQWNLLDTPL